MSKTKKFFFAALMACFVCSTVSVDAQTDSPYSRYGLGYLRDQATGPAKGMGGVAYGLHTSQSANPLNPASYAQVDSLTFIFDIGVTYNNTTYKEGVEKASKNGGGLDYITMLFPVSRQLGISFGILPFSSTGYQLGNTKTLQSETQGDNVSYYTTHVGSGGLSQAYFGLGYQLPIEGLSVGANISYLFGKLTHQNLITRVDGLPSDLPSEFTTLSISTVKLDFGLQYRFNLKERSSLTLGAVYTPQMNSNAKLTISQLKGTEATTPINQTIDAGMPHVVGFGFAYNRKQNLLLGADVTYQKWKNVKYSNLLGDDLSSGNRFNNRWKIALGGEYQIAQYSKNYFHKIKFRGGLNYSNSYINVKTKADLLNPKGYKEYGATVGFGLPLRDRDDLDLGRTSYLNINFEYKHLKPELKGMVSERFFGVSLNMNINELWFMQRKIN